MPAIPPQRTVTDCVPTKLARRKLTSQLHPPSHHYSLLCVWNFHAAFQTSQRKMTGKRWNWPKTSLFLSFLFMSNFWANRSDHKIFWAESKIISDASLKFFWAESKFIFDMTIKYFERNPNHFWREYKIFWAESKISICYLPNIFPSE